MPIIYSIVCIQTNLDQNCKLARDILVEEASFPTSQKAYFTHHTNIRFESKTKIIRSHYIFFLFF